ncbi:MAG TPA: hypothetical protein VL443_06270 [Cyclobacteriaceae bacterium]|nr:hypothetical protein [Cyclobacteriaceae bacterium]
MIRRFLLFIMLTIAIFSCSDDNSDSVFVKVENKTNSVVKTEGDFALKGIDGYPIKQLPIDLLSTIHDRLIKDGRSDDAKKLYVLYDMKTGVLKGSENTIAANGRINSQYAPNGVYAYVHEQDYGDIGPFLQSSSMSDGAPSSYAGVTGQSKRLEGVWFDTAPELVSTRPYLEYGLVDISGPGNTFINTWGEFNGTRGKDKAVSGIIMIIDDLKPWKIWYKAHNQGVGWNQPWHTDWEYAGVKNKRLEAFAFYIMIY